MIFKSIMEDSEQIFPSSHQGSIDMIHFKKLMFKSLKCVNGSEVWDRNLLISYLLTLFVITLIPSLAVLRMGATLESLERGYNGSVAQCARRGGNLRQWIRRSPRDKSLN